ncbi:hypothetical protein HXX76_012576 [Chlamydomonas incerta]|uniref:Chloride channel protein n=1 Tax=Chlamydomonas incerta TaxID=51695 RepID=A0A835VTB3_CHLIN|nr:hypothetical protein HXX76_012576 [Chlamydomonas incerta]|eukprot:KAG2427060.1 hypothetical protein HXX76_012576 [Chlamydomonas incerta]
MAPSESERFASRPFSHQYILLEQQEREARTSREWRLRSAYYWLCALVAGCAAGTWAFVLNALTEALQVARYEATIRHITPGGGFFLPWLAFAGTAAAYAALAGAAVTRLAPIAAGSGVPQMKAWINGVSVPGAVSPLTLLVKGVGVTLSIAAGLVAGKEGPYIHSGGILGYMTAQGGRLAVKRWAAREVRREAGVVKTAGSSPGGGGGGGRWWQPHALLRRRRRPQLEFPDLGPPAAAAADVAAVGADGMATGGNSGSGGRGARPAASDRPPPAWVPPVAAVEPREQSDAASVGTSAGVAVAFTAPVAGVAYAVEEGTTVFSVTVLWKAYLSAGMAVCVMQLLTVAASGKAQWSFSTLRMPTELSFRSVSNVWGIFWFHAWELPLLVVLGLLGGAMGGLWTLGAMQLLTLRKRLLGGPRHKLARNIEVALVAAATATIWLGVCYGSPCAPLPPGHQALSAGDAGRTLRWLYFDGPDQLFPQLWCPEGTYCEWGQLFWMPVETAARAMFSVHPAAASEQQPLHPPPPPGAAAAAASDPAADLAFSFSAAALGLFVGLAYPGLLLTYGVAAPTGIFIPTLAIGGAAGRLAGRAVQAALDNCGVSAQISLPAWGVVGAAALLAGITRLLLATCLIVTETSGGGPLLVPIVLATTAAKLVADTTSPCIYDWQMAAAGFQYLEDSASLPPGRLSALVAERVGRVMTREPLASLPERPTLAHVLQWLRTHKHSFIPVVRYGRGGAAAAGAAAAAAAGVCGDEDGSGGGDTARHAASPDWAAPKGSGGGNGATEPAPKGSSNHAPGALPRQLVGVVHRWQLVSCLRHPGLLRDMLFIPEEQEEQAQAQKEQEHEQEHEQRQEKREEQQEQQQRRRQQRAPDAAAPLGRRERLAALALMAQSPGELPAAEEAALLEAWMSAEAEAAVEMAAEAAADVSGAAAAGPQEAQGVAAGVDGSPPAAAPAAAEGAVSISIALALHAAAGAAGAKHEAAAAAESDTCRGAGPAWLRRRLDLAALLLATPHSLPPDAPAQEALLALRHLGLHSVPVAAPSPALLGLVTRADLFRAELEEGGQGQGGEGRRKKEQ